MNVEKERERNRNSARSVIQRLQEIDSFDSLTNRPGNLSTWQWANAVIYALGQERPVVVDARLAEAETDTYELVAISENRVAHIRHAVDKTNPAVRVFPRSSLRNLTILEADEVLESSDIGANPPQLRVRLTYDDTTFELPLEGTDRYVSHQLRDLVPTLFEDLNPA